MRQRRFVTLRVFTAPRLFDEPVGGMIVAQNLDGATMQNIARESGAIAA
jgi:predicted PhzF superfamily epimerase YddE/YHI9